jgi:hypothetical protein
MQIGHNTTIVPVSQVTTKTEERVEVWDRVLVVRLEVVTRLSSNARSSTANLRSCSRVKLGGVDW